MSGKTSKGVVVKKMLKPWYCLSLGDGMMAPMPTAEIEEAFVDAFAAAGSPLEMAVFTRLESEGRLPHRRWRRHLMLNRAGNLRGPGWAC